MSALTKYVLRLASDPEEHEKFRKSKESAKKAMTEAGLKDEHQEMLLGCDAPAITKAINDEMPATAAVLGACQSCTLTVTLTYHRPA